MKKRRELDALVSNGKLPRRKSKSGHELLRSDCSESSEIEEFSAPLGKKNGRKWTDSGLCSTCLALSGLITVAACLIACAGLIWMHFELKRDLDNLRGRIDTVESRSKNMPEELQKFHTQLVSLNKSVQEMKTGSHGLNALNKNITALSNKMKALGTTTESLQGSLKAASTMTELPGKVITLSNTIASVGSSQQSVAADVEKLKTFQSDAAKQLAGITARLSDMEGGGRESMHPTSTSDTPDQAALKQQVGDLKGKIRQVNDSYILHVTVLSKSLQSFQTRIASLESLTQALATNLTSLTNKVAQSVTTNNEQGSHPPVPSNPASGVESDQSGTALDSISARVDNITNVVVALKQQFVKLQDDHTTLTSANSTSQATDVVTQEAFIDFQHVTMMNIEHLNDTVKKLENDVDHLYKKLVHNTNNLVNISHILNGALRYLASKQLINHTAASATTGPRATTLNSDAVTSPSETATQTITPMKQRVISTKAPESAPAIHIDGIVTFRDLFMKFHLWDRDGKGYVEYNDLPEYLGPQDTPEEAILKQFDENGDGRYTIDEFAKALGISAQNNNAADSTASP